MLINKSKIKLITSSSFDDDGFDCEIWGETTCLMVISINDDSKITVVFGEINNNSITYEELSELLNHAREIVINKQNDFKKNNIKK